MGRLHTGGGLAGLSAANKLAKGGHPVTVYDMGTRGPGTHTLGPPSLKQGQNVALFCHDSGQVISSLTSALLFGRRMRFCYCSGSSCVGMLALGGRASTRQVEHGGTALQFDHGSQFLRVSDPTVQQHAKEWEQQGELHLTL